MNLIDKYVAEIGKHLPRKQRADIEAEIHSTLEDMLEERKQGQGLADEATILQLLKEYGAPREVAAKYKSHPYLIGPRMYPMFERVLRIVSAVLIGVSLLGLGVDLAQNGLSGPAFISAMSKWFGSLLGGLITAFGNIALIFAILERTATAEKFEKEFKEWDPNELKQEPDPDQVDLPDHIATIIFTFLGLVVFNLYPDLIAIRILDDGTMKTIPVLTAVFFSFLPWINIMGLLQIGFHGYMLGQKNWNLATRILGIGLDIAGLILGVTILRTPGIFGLTPEALTALGAPEAADTLAKLFNTLPTIIITIIVIVTTVKTIKILLRLFTNTSRSPYPISK